MKKLILLKKNDEIKMVTKKKTSKIETKITNEDKEIDEIEKIIDDELNDLKVSKKKTSKPNIIINDDSNETKEKKLSKELKLRKAIIIKFDELY